MVKGVRVLLLASLLLFALSGCAVPEPNIRPSLVVNDSVVIPVLPTSYLDVHMIPGAVPVYIYHDESRVANIINCGSEAYGEITVDKIKFLLSSNDLTLGELLVTNSSNYALGGCKEIMIWFPEIKRVRIFINETESVAYVNLLRWTPSRKLVQEHGRFVLSYGGTVIDLDALLVGVTTFRNDTEVIE